MSRVWVLALLLLAVTGMPSVAGGFADGVRYVFVATGDGATVSVIDSRDDRVAGSLDLGLVPLQMEATGDGGRLVAVDGASARVAVVSADSGAVVMVPLGFVPTRLALTADGGRAVAAAPEAGRLAVVDLAVGRVAAEAAPGPFRDVAVAGERAAVATAEGVTLFDLGTLAPLARLGDVAGGFATLARAPNGRILYARAAEAAVVAAVDVAAGRITGTVASNAPRAYTNATGITLILPEAGEGGLALVPASLGGATHLKGEAGVTGVYSGWFDTVAFLPSAASRSVVVVDQPGRARDDDIILGAVPGRGTVTPDGRKLYLPLTDTHRVAVIDAERRMLAGYVALPHKPRMAVMARTFGLCH